MAHKKLTNEGERAARTGNSRVSKRLVTAMRGSSHKRVKQMEARLLVEERVLSGVGTNNPKIEVPTVMQRQDGRGDRFVGSAVVDVASRQVMVAANDPENTKAVGALTLSEEEYRLINAGKGNMHAKLADRDRVTGSVAALVRRIPRDTRSDSEKAVDAALERYVVAEGDEAPHIPPERLSEAVYAAWRASGEKQPRSTWQVRAIVAHLVERGLVVTHDADALHEAWIKYADPLRLREARRARGMTQPEVAAALVAMGEPETGNRISKYEAGDYPVIGDLIYGMAEALRVKPECLFAAGPPVAESLLPDAAPAPAATAPAAPAAPAEPARPAPAPTEPASPTLPEPVIVEPVIEWRPVSAEAQRVAEMMRETADLVEDMSRQIDYLKGEVARHRARVEPMEALIRRQRATITELEDQIAGIGKEDVR